MIAKHRLVESVKRLLQVTFALNSKTAFWGFWAASTVLPAVFLAGMITRAPIGTVVCAALFIAALPTIILLVRLQALRAASSKEGEILLTELLDNYKINYFNMQQAVEVTALSIEEAPNCKRLLFNLSKGLNRAAGSSEIKGFLQDFRFAIGTSWAGVLADNIYFALVSGVKVTAAMEDLIKTVSKAKEVEEYARRENNEATLILKYLAPGCYFLTVIGGIKYFGLTPREFFHYQFETEAGLGWFTACVLTYSIGMVAKKFLTKGKLDL